MSLSVHVVRLHIRIKLFSVLLLVRLDIVEPPSVVIACKFKDAGIVKSGNMLLGRKHITAQKSIVFRAFCAVCTGVLYIYRLARLAGHIAESTVMPFFNISDRSEKPGELTA